MLSETAISKAAVRIGCSVAAIKAVAKIESGKAGGFSAPGRPVVLFEGHWFHRYTKGKFAKTHPSLCYPKWTKAYYEKTQALEWERFQQAYALDPRAAVLSASYGLFQVMGFNFAICGYKTPEVFFNAMRQSEDNHLDAFDDYVVNSGLADELQRLDWAGFAHGYNGPEWQKNNYAAKLEAAFKQFSA